VPACHAAIARWKGGTGVRVALAGNPNVGKSSIFNRLTGMGVETANYPGKTVEVQLATTVYDGRELGVMDLPGTYALGGTSEDQWVARRALLEGGADVVIVVVDATRLERNLYLALQLLDLGVPVVIALNLVDEAWRRGLRVDHVQLGRLLGVPVVPTVAVRGIGLDRLVDVAVRAATAAGPLVSRPRYGADVESAVTRLAARIEAVSTPRPWPVPARALALLLLEGDDEAAAWAREEAGVRGVADEEAAVVAERHGEPVDVRIVRERHGLAGEIGARVKLGGAGASTAQDRVWRRTTAPVTGYVLAGLVLAGLFATLFWVGGFLSEQLTALWEALASPVVRGALHAVLGDGLVARVLVWGLDGGVNAALAVGVPYVLVFYAILSLLEDTGYLNAVAFLTDPLMHRFGLHGRAVIPLVAGAGCNVPAIMGTRVLATTRERILASTLVCLVPCSARTAVIAGAVSKYVGWSSALAVYGVVTVLAIAVGVALNRVLPGRPVGLVMEMFPFRFPGLRTTARKTWRRFSGFVWVATPVVLAGSLGLGLLYETGAIWVLAAPLAPVVEGWLGLPAVAGLTLVFAVLRKELALQLLVTLAVARHGAAASALAAFMDGGQIFTYALVNTLWIPCIATVAVLARELGWPRALGIAALTVVLAVAAGGVVHRVWMVWAEAAGPLAIMSR
jgi:ferrous iron transport protein B